MNFERRAVCLFEASMPLLPSYSTTTHIFFSSSIFFFVCCSADAGGPPCPVLCTGSRPSLYTALARPLLERDGAWGASAPLRRTSTGMRACVFGSWRSFTGEPIKKNDPFELRFLTSSSGLCVFGRPEIQKENCAWENF